MEVNEERRRQARAEGEQTADEIERWPIDEHSRQRAKSSIPATHERQRAKEMLAELSIRDPRGTFGPRLERQRVDENRRHASELHVVRAGVLERHPVLDRKVLDSKGRLCSGLQLPE
jgi:hypothetical protein